VGDWRAGGGSHGSDHRILRESSGRFRLRTRGGTARRRTRRRDRGPTGLPGRAPLRPSPRPRHYVLSVSERQARSVQCRSGAGIPSGLCFDKRSLANTRREQITYRVSQAILKHLGGLRECGINAPHTSVDRI
jgi:hypothetical protein